MKGEIPISYIVAIVLAIAVLALLGYWFYMSGGKFSGSVNRQDCLNLKLRYCTEWGTKGFTGTPDWNNYPSATDQKGKACRDMFQIKVDSSTDCLNPG